MAGPLAVPRIAVALALVLIISSALAADGPTSPSSSPIPPELWNRTYIEEVPLDWSQSTAELLAACAEDLHRGVLENASPGLRIGVLGDSVTSQIRASALADPALHWM